MNKKRVLLGMSGGIDSTVSAMLLLEQGYEVVGVTFRTYDSIKESCLAREKGCCSIDSIMEAKNNAQKMGFEHHIVDFRDTFREHVINNFIDEYMHGRTPNPCVLCNSHIKWGELIKFADEIGCEYISTGHYATIRYRNTHTFLSEAADQHKDQTYFLWMLTEANLQRTIFPLGGLTKAEVRDIARAHGYNALAEKAESQEICFVTDNDYRSFLRENVENYSQIAVPGNYIDKEGKVLGQHTGFPNYTIGQRKGLGIALGAPAYVTHINPETNEITLGTNDDLMQSTCFATQFRLRDPEWIKESPEVMARIRYKSKPVSAKIEQIDGLEKNREGEYLATCTIRFDQPVWGVTPGQSLVLYKDGLVVGGGIIER